MGYHRVDRSWSGFQALLANMLIPRPEITGASSSPCVIGILGALAGRLAGHQAVSTSTPSRGFFNLSTWITRPSWGCRHPAAGPYHMVSRPDRPPSASLKRCPAGEAWMTGQ